MKKLWLIGGVVVLVLIAFLTWRSPEAIQFNNTDNSKHPDASNASFSIDGEVVTLSNGVSQTKDEIGLTSETTLLKNFIAYGDLNKDGNEDSALLLEVSGGGSGTFIYLAGFISGTLNRKGTEAVFIGDRIAPKTIAIKNGVITLTYLDRQSNEPFSSEPTVLKTKQFSLSNNSLVEK